MSLPGAEQEVHTDGETYELVMREPLPVEGWNAQISLLTGRAAARLMLDGGIGILRTMPEPSAADVGWGACGREVDGHRLAEGCRLCRGDLRDGPSGGAAGGPAQRRAGASARRRLHGVPRRTAGSDDSFRGRRAVRPMPPHPCGVWSTGGACRSVCRCANSPPHPSGFSAASARYRR